MGWEKEISCVMCLMTPQDDCKLHVLQTCINKTKIKDVISFISTGCDLGIWFSAFRTIISIPQNGEMYACEFVQ